MSLMHVTTLDYDHFLKATNNKFLPYHNLLFRECHSDTSSTEEELQYVPG